MVSDTHSINGKTNYWLSCIYSYEKYLKRIRSTGESQELEHSTSSTDPHTVSLYTDAQSFSAPIQIAPTRGIIASTRGIMANSVMNSDYYVETSDNAPVTASSNKNDVIT